MHLSLLTFAALLPLTRASPVGSSTQCTNDVCLKEMKVLSFLATPFCAIYTKVPQSHQTPSFFTFGDDCLKPAKLSSACSCLHYTSTATKTSSTSSSSSIPVSATTTSSESSITSSDIPTSSTSSAAPTTSSESSTSSTSSAAPTSTSESFPTTSSSAAPTSTAASSSAAPTSTSESSPSTSSSATPTSTAASCTSPAPGAILVDNGATPAQNSYPTVQEGVNALSLTNITAQSLFIYPGEYYEQVYVPALKSPLTIQGYTTDCSTYTSNTATITYNLALINTTSDDLTATLRLWSPNTKVYNLNIANTFGHISKNGQNLAVSAHTGNQGYYGVQLLGYQDTLLANTGNQLYAKSLITGAVDFIFGQTATAWFEQVDIRTIAAGSVTASGRSSDSNPSWYVINNSTVDGINSTIAAGTNYLGRPWQSFARVVFQNSYLGAIINPAGWSVWSTAVNGSTNIGNVTFAEYGNYGPGSVLNEGPRANFSEQLDAPVVIEDILGSGYADQWWVDMSYL